MSDPRHPGLVSLAAVVALLAAAAAVMPAAATDRIVIVRPGDTLSQIALEEGVSVAQLIALNGIADPSRIYPGQRLIIRTSAAPAKPAPTPVVHRVGSGENLTLIATRYGVTIAAIVTANALANPSYLRVGQLLTMPVAASPSGAAAPSSRSARSMSAAMSVVVAQRDDVRRLLVKEAKAQGVAVALVEALAWQESGWQQRAVSSTGAIGVMQLMPATADWIGTAMLGTTVDPSDVTQNIQAGVRLLRHYMHRYGGDRSLALAAYYQGERGTDLNGIYPATRPYVAAILALEALFGH